MKNEGFRTLRYFIKTVHFVYTDWSLLRK